VTADIQILSLHAGHGGWQLLLVPHHYHLDEAQLERNEGLWLQTLMQTVIGLMAQVGLPVPTPCTRYLSISLLREEDNVDRIISAPAMVLSSALFLSSLCLAAEWLLQILLDLDRSASSSPSSPCAAVPTRFVYWLVQDENLVRSGKVQLGLHSVINNMP
jgi:hypothetical protein